MGRGRRWRRCEMLDQRTGTDKARNIFFCFQEPSIFTLSNVFLLESKRSALGPSRSSLFSSRAPVSTGSWQVWGQETGQSWILTRFTQVPSPRSGLAWLAEQGGENTLVPPSGAFVAPCLSIGPWQAFSPPDLSFSLSLPACPALTLLLVVAGPAAFQMIVPQCCY